MTDAADAAPPAGYVSPYPYAARLQERMDELIDRRTPNAGVFCGFCFARLAEGAERCPWCATETAERATVAAVPAEVLRIYRAGKRTEAAWVYAGAMLGLLLAAAAFVALVAWATGPLGHPGVAFLVLIGGGYLLAQLFGPLIGAQIGYRRGTRARDRRWAAFLEARGDAP